MIKSKKQMFIVIGVFTLVMLLGTVTYAFFNYTRTGATNTISVGRISFVSRQTQTISLTNLFPIDPSETGIMDDDTKVGTLEIEIEGDTDYAQGVEYLISATDANIYTSTGQVIPITLDFTVTGLGTSNANYFTERENKNANIYKKLVGDTLVGDQMLLVGYIKPNTTSGQIEGVNGSITIKAYLDQNKILISDTYDGTESDEMGTPNSVAGGRTVITTNEWNAKEMSFKVKVEANEGIWVNESLEEIMKQENIGIDTENGVDFSKTSEKDGLNGAGTNGVYMRAGTENDANPILYFRGAVENNNVLFANQCWKTVRTTDTGGVKLVYNGSVSVNKAALSRADYGTLVSNNGFVFDTSDNSWNAIMTSNITSNEPYEISFNVPAGDEYLLQIIGVPSVTGPSGGIVYKGGTEIKGYGGSSQYVLNYSFGALTSSSSDIIKVTFFSFAGDNTVEKPSTIKIKMLYPNENFGMGCDNVETDVQITKNNENLFQFSGLNLNKSPAYVGYMWGNNVYEYKQKNSNSIFKFGTGFTFENGKYTLTGAENGIANTRHYTCFTTNGVCDGGDLGKIYYVYYKQGNDYYYIELENGKNAEDALREMQMNIVNSNAKEIIDEWYDNNMTTYTNMIEDTIYCNDRSMGIGNNNGWISNGGDLNTALLYGGNYRSPRDGIVTPILSCPNKNDSFTVNNENGNQSLTYPVGMLTIDEMILAGGRYTYQNSTNYLKTNTYYWNMSPSSFYNNFSIVSGIGEGHLSVFDTSVKLGLRPAVSLKPGMPVVSGDGTANNPYKIGN